MKNTDDEEVFELPEDWTDTHEALGTHSILDSIDDELDLDTIIEELPQLMSDFAQATSIYKDKKLEADELKETILNVWDGSGSPYVTDFGRIFHRNGSSGKDKVDDKACVKLLQKAVHFESAVSVFVLAGFDKEQVTQILKLAVGKIKLPMTKTASRKATLEFEALDDDGEENESEE